MVESKMDENRATSTFIQRGAHATTQLEPRNGHGNPRRMAIIASKGTLDMAYPPLVLASTAASMGWEVAIYFTFYGLYVVHKDHFQHLQVSPVGNPAMPPPIHAFPQFKIPTILGALPGMTAMATAMMNRWMGDAHLVSIPELLQTARELGVHLYACNT